MSDVLHIEHEHLYREALTAMVESGPRFMVGGAFAVYHYTNWWRSTHDIDLYVAPQDKDPAMETLKSAGFRDIGQQAEGDEHWIYHTSKKAIIVDIIWGSANLTHHVSSDWFERASLGRFLDMELLYLPLEEFILMKTFVINRHRCDWPDVMRIIRYQCDNIHWQRLLDLFGEHWLLLSSLVDVFDWQHARCMQCIPDHVREELAWRRRNYRETAEHVEREHLLDPWIHQRSDRYVVWRDEQPDG